MVSIGLLHWNFNGQSLLRFTTVVETNSAGTCMSRLGRNEDLFMTTYPEAEQSIAKLLNVLYKQSSRKERKSKNGSLGQRKQLNLNECVGFGEAV